MDLKIEGDLLGISPEVLGEFFTIPITNTMLMAVFDFFLLIFLMIFVSRFTIKNPGKIQIFIEFIMDSLTSLINQVVEDEVISKKIMPLIASLIIYILISNLALIFFPILTGFTYEGKFLFRTHTGDFNTTLAMAFGILFLVQMYSIQKLSLLGYILKYIQIDKIIKGFMGGIKSGLEALINAFVGILNLIGEISKVFSLSLRLFGNMFAGELLGAVLLSIFAIGLPVPIAMLALLAGTVQAIVFGSLSASFLKEALMDEDINSN